MTDLHDAIMRIAAKPDAEWPAGEQQSYKLGHRDARHAAAELALAAPPVQQPAPVAGQEPFGMYVERDDGTTEFQRTGRAFQGTAQGYKAWMLFAAPVPAASVQPEPEAKRIAQVLMHMAGNDLIRWNGTGNDEDDAWNTDEEYRTTLAAVKEALAAQQPDSGRDAALEGGIDAECEAAYRRIYTTGTSLGAGYASFRNGFFAAKVTQAGELSDEQIIDIAVTTRSAEANKDGGYMLPISFARAILAAAKKGGAA